MSDFLFHYLVVFVLGDSRVLPGYELKSESAYEALVDARICLEADYGSDIPLVAGVWDVWDERAGKFLVYERTVRDPEALLSLEKDLGHGIEVLPV